jgi:GDP-mannose transporter
MKGIRSNGESLTSVLVYSLSSISMILLNKAFVKIFDARLTFSILALQSFLGLCLVVMAKRMDYISYPEINRKMFLEWIPIALLNIIMIVSGMWNLQYISIPLFTVFKNITTILVALGERQIMRKEISNFAFLAFFVIILGNVVSCIDATLFYSISGVFWTATNIIVTAAYLLYMRYVLSKSGSNLGNFGPLVYNNMISAPILIGLALLTGEVFQLHHMYYPLFNARNLSDGLGMSVFIMLILDGAFIGFTSFWCVQCTSATTMSVIGSVNKIPLAFLGEYLFIEIASYWGRIGVLLVVVGGLMYGGVTTTEKKKEVLV